MPLNFPDDWGIRTGWKALPNFKIDHNSLYGVILKVISEFQRRQAGEIVFHKDNYFSGSQSYVDEAITTDTIIDEAIYRFMELHGHAEGEIIGQTIVECLDELEARKLAKYDDYNDTWKLTPKGWNFIRRSKNATKLS